MSVKPDDLEAVRKIVDALQAFDSSEQERIIRWVREKIGLPSAGAIPASPSTPAGASQSMIPGGQARDLRAFVDAKAPGSDVQFVTAVAYYYRFDAPESERKDSVNSEDLLEACRKAGRVRLQNPGQTLRNAHRDGLLDRADRGAFSINAVGENLVAMTLPTGAASAPRAPRGTKSGKNKRTAK